MLIDLHYMKFIRGGAVIGEQPFRATSWTRTAWRGMKTLLPFAVVVRGCRVGLKAPNGRLLSKTWKFCTDNPWISTRLSNLARCTCAADILPHVPCDWGCNAHHSERYPPALSRLLVEAAKGVSAFKLPSAPVPRGALGKLASTTTKWRVSVRQSVSRSVQKRNAAIGRHSSPPTSAPARKRCRQITSACFGGLSVTPANDAVAVRKRLQKGFGMLRGPMLFAYQNTSSVY